MRFLLLGSRVVLWSVVTCGLLAVSFAATKTPEPQTPVGLVKAALESELTGSSEVRDQLLGEALKTDPNFAPARWQSGFVKWGSEWLKPAEVAQRAADNKQLAAYRKMRNQLVDTADNHRAMARWCHKNKLKDEERIHWAKVIEFEPSDAEALSGLGLQLHDGRLLTRAQIEQENVTARDQRRATRHWQPQFVKWRAAIERGNPEELDDTLGKLKSLSDPTAIPALESVFAANRASSKRALLNTLAIETVSRMPQIEATQVLLRLAINPDSIEVRTAAADELKKRPMHSYVPLLIAAMPSTLKSTFHVHLLPNGTVIHEHEFLLEGQQANYSMVYESVMSPSDAFSSLVMTPAVLNRENRSAAMAEAQVKNIEQQQKFVRDRIVFVLARTTGFDNADTPESWLKQYNDYYGWDSGHYKPTYSQYASNYETYSGPPSPSQPRSQPMPQTQRPRQHSSCFAAGTPVLTLYGSTPIETIKAGDRVLAQNVETGELCFKPVQETTLRRTAQVSKIHLGSETIVASPGHAFWLSGQGWQVAKHLSVGVHLHGLSGTTLVDQIEEEATPREVYNLVVSDFENYFVGEHRVLVHDYSSLKATMSLVPGLAAEAHVP